MYRENTIELPERGRTGQYCKMEGKVISLSAVLGSCGVSTVWAEGNGGLDSTIRPNISHFRCTIVRILE